MKSVTIGSVIVDTPVCLAPMAGVSHIAYRKICDGMGAGYCPTELVSARSIKYNGIAKSMQYLRIDPEAEKIPAIQLFGSEPEDFESAIEQIMEDALLQNLRILDINMGCPVPKVVKTGAGSALMSDIARAASIVRASKKKFESMGLDIPVTVKTRIGFEAEDKGNPDFAKALADAGADMICVHGRTKPQMYMGDCNRDAVALMREAVRDYKIPFFANGDVTDGKSAKELMDYTGADGVMIGRAARGNPWVIRDTVDYLNGVETKASPTDEDKREMLIRELEERCSYCAEDIAVREFRSVMPFYIKGIKGAARLKVALCSALSIAEVRKILGFV